MADEMTSPLAGVKVVEITTIYSGPMAGMLLVIQLKRYAVDESDRVNDSLEMGD